MKSTLFLVLMSILMIMPLFSAMAQDPGIPDTVRLGCPVYSDLIVGDSIAVPVYLFNDEPISGLSLGLIKDSSAVKFLRTVKNTAVIPAGFVWKTTIRDTVKMRPHTQSIIFGGADFTGESPIPAVTGSTGQLLGTMYLLIQAGATAETINIDSSFIPPAGRWEAAYFDADGNALPLSPQYVHCSPDIILGDGEPEPEITHVIPGMACPDQSLWVYIIGQDTQFGQGSPTTTSVWFSQSSPTLTPINADVVNVISPTQVNAHFLIPMDAPFGLRDVSVQNQGDPSPATRPNGFEIVPRPALVSVEPDSGRRGDSLSVSITGVNTHFYQSSSSSLIWLSQGSSTIYSSSLNVHTSTLLDAWFSIPQQTPTGLWDVSVSDPVYGLPVATLTNGFTVYVYSCGDVDGSGQIDISDAVYLINYIFGGGAPPLDEAKGDVDCSNQTDISDAVYLVKYVFDGGSAPCTELSCPPK